jgi:hypothetical protein
LHVHFRAHASSTIAARTLKTDKPAAVAKSLGRVAIMASGVPTVLAEPRLRGDGLAVDAIDAVDEIDDLAAVEALIQAEMTRFEPEDYLARLPAPPAARDGAMTKLPPYVPGTWDALPPAPAATVEAGDAAVDEWERAVIRARVAVEAQSARAINLELASKYGVEAWKAHLQGLERLETAAKGRVAAIARKVEEVQAARAARVTEAAAAKLRGSVRRWTDAVGSVTTAELAVAEAQREVKRLRKLADAAGL